MFEFIKGTFGVFLFLVACAIIYNILFKGLLVGNAAREYQRKVARPKVERMLGYKNKSNK